MKVGFVTLGCKVNQYETQALEEAFTAAGCTLSRQDADMYVVNTCSVTAAADRKCRDAIRTIRKRNPGAKIVACGCLAQLNRSDLEALGVDIVVAQEQKHQLANIVLDTEAPGHDIWGLTISRFPNQRAFVKIQDGCDNFCAYCKIPYIRGRSKSRPVQSVLDEVQRLSVRHPEIVLCGVNLAAYGKDLNPACSLTDVIQKIITIESLQRVRLSSLESCFVPKGLLELLAHKKVCPHLHLPFQSGDDHVLAAMNKKERVADYEQLVACARQVVPDVAISCDIIVGFPAEGEQEFKNTVAFLHRIKPMRLHVFTFSVREKTAMAKAKQLPASIVRQRYHALVELGNTDARQYRQSLIGKPCTMVTEEKTKQGVVGYTEHYIRITVPKDLPLGRLVGRVY